MECYIEYLDAKNKFRPTKKEFENYESAVIWAKENLKNYHRDMVKFY
jgi:hypothetical protein